MPDSSVIDWGVVPEIIKKKPLDIVVCCGMGPTVLDSNITI